MTHTQLVKVIRRRMKKLDMTPYRLHQMLGGTVAKQTVYNFVEHDRAVTKVLEISSQKELLDTHRVLRDSIRQRNPYVDPLSYAQVILLQEIRSGKTKKNKEELERAVLLSINGVAHALRNTG